MIDPYAEIAFILLASIVSLLLLYAVISAIKYIFGGDEDICKVYPRANNHIVCPKNNKNQEIYICKGCPHYRGYDSSYVKCAWYKRLGGDF